MKRRLQTLRRKIDRLRPVTPTAGPDIAAFAAKLRAAVASDEIPEVSQEDASDPAKFAIALKTLCGPFSSMIGNSDPLALAVDLNETIKAMRATVPGWNGEAVILCHPASPAGIPGPDPEPVATPAPIITNDISPVAFRRKAPDIVRGD